MGALAWDNWTKTDAGGTGSVPEGVVNKDYLRCKACHGWDHMGTDGGYARRSRKDSRPNAGFADGDMTSRNLSFAVRGEGELITAEMILHTGTGRVGLDGTDSWVALDDAHSATNKAAHENGYTLGNQHPDFSGGELTAEQVGCLVEFLNFEDADPSAYFEMIYPTTNPVKYTVKMDADAAAGETYYNANCAACHGDPAEDNQPGSGGVPEGGLLAYLANDGKFSEFSHKVRWGIPDTIMTRSTSGSPTSSDVADIMLWLLPASGNGFAINPGLSGHWWGGAERSGEGFLIEVATSEGITKIIVSFYTYDNMGNQVWLIGSGEINGNTAEITLTIPEGAMWGADFDPADVPIPRQEWGTGTITFTSCGAGDIALVPNAMMQGRGFTDLAYNINRDLVDPGVACPTPAN